MYPPTSTRLFSFYCYGAHRDLHSFPTRRSSDLGAAAARSRRLLAFTHPPDRWYLRGGFSVVNFFLWLGRSAFRIFVHPPQQRSEEHTSELQSRRDLVCRLLLEKKKKTRVHRST